MRESAIILPVPSAEPLVQRWRLQHDPSASLGIPAHITLLYPFAPADAALAESDSLASLLAGFAAFEVRFAEFGRFTATSYLRLENPEPILRLTQTITKQWPEYPPYGGRFADVIPHLTVADGAGDDVLTLVEREIEKHLPLACLASEVHLMCSDHQGRWTMARSFVLG